MNDNEKFICIDINDGWYVKVKDNYDNIKYIEISKNLSTTEIENVEDIFKYLILPKTYVDPYGYTITWEIYDRENLYTLEDIPMQYWSTNENPECTFYQESISESESWIEFDYRTQRKMMDFNYFDQITQNL